MIAEETLTVAQNFGATVVIAVIVLPLVSIWVPRVRIPTGLLLIGFAIALLVVGAWRLATGLPVHEDRVVLGGAALIAGGILLFRWGRRAFAP